VTKDDDEAATPQASSTVDELVVWVREQIGQLRKLAQDCLAEVGRHMAGEQYEDGSGEAYKDAYPSYPWGSGEGELAYMAATQPRYVLTQCEAHVALLDEHSSPHTVVDGFCVEEGGPCTHAGESECLICGVTDCRTARLLASAYRHCPGYQEPWRL
jgi:hypothetical protein